MMSASARERLSALAPVLGLVFVIGVFALLSDDPAQYLSPRNLRIVLAQTVIVALGAIGMTFIIISGGIDLAVGSTIALAGVVTALGVRDGYPPIVAVAAGVVTGGLVGIVNGLAITRLKVLPFIGTLGMLGIARGVAKWLANQQTVNAPETWVNELAVTFPTPSWLLVAPGVWISLVLAVAATFLLQQTVFGRRVFAVGSNEAAARACGVQTDRLKVWIYGLAGLLFGLSGVMQMSRLRQGDPTVAIGTELDVIAAVVIGGGSLSGGEGTIAGSLIGALVMAFLRNGSQQMGWPNYVQEIIIGVIIVLAVAADRARRRKEIRRSAELQNSAVQQFVHRRAPRLRGSGGATEDSDNSCNSAMLRLAQICDHGCGARYVEVAPDMIAASLYSSFCDSTFQSGIVPEPVPLRLALGHAGVGEHVLELRQAHAVDRLAEEHRPEADLAEDRQFAAAVEHLDLLQARGFARPLVAAQLEDPRLGRVGHLQLRHPREREQQRTLDAIEGRAIRGGVEERVGGLHVGGIGGEAPADADSRLRGGVRDQHHRRRRLARGHVEHARPAPGRDGRAPAARHPSGRRAWCRACSRRGCGSGAVRRTGARQRQAAPQHRHRRPG